jgi:hypothetical protein
MGSARNNDGKDETYTYMQNLVGKPETRPRGDWRIINFKETGHENVDWINVVPDEDF